MSEDNLKEDERVCGYCKNRFSIEDYREMRRHMCGICEVGEYE